MDTPFTDKIESADVAKMPAEYQTLLKRVLAIQADCEIGGPHLYVRSILPDAPTKVDRLIVARTAAEEADHYRKVARLAGEVGEDRSEEHTSELQSHSDLVCRLLLEKKKENHSFLRTQPATPTHQS